MKAISSILLLMLAVGVLQAADTTAADADKPDLLTDILKPRLSGKKGKR